MRFLALFLAAGSAPSVAAAPSGPRPPISVSNGVVCIAGRPLLRFRTSLAGVPPDPRAALVALRLQEMISQGRSPRSVHWRKDGPNAHVRVGDLLLWCVTPEEARAQRSMPASLAETWARRLTGLLSTPVLAVSTRRLVVPVGENRSLAFTGLLQAPQAVAGGTGVVRVTLEPQRRRAVVCGLKPGHAHLTFSHEGVSIPVDAVVRKFAGRLADRAEGSVTGWVAPRELVTRVAMAAARQAVSVEPGAAARLGEPRVRGGVAAGSTTHVSVPVRIYGPRYLPVVGEVAVAVHNERLPRAEEPELFYSNDPEQVKAYGTLFLGRLSAERPARLLYHHLNARGGRLALTVDVVNPAREPVRLHITEGNASPAADPLRAGHRAARAFLRNQRAGTGYIAVLPPRSFVTVAHYALQPGEVASGLCCLRQLDGSAGCYVQVKADDVRSPFVRPPNGKEPLSATVFGTAVKPVAAVYDVGGGWTFIRLGSPEQRGASRLSEEGFGDYGVTYDIALTLNNGTPHAQKVGLVFEAASGAARGLFVVDGKMVETRTLNAQEEMLLAVYSLPAGGMRNVRVSTLPLSGSAYPARLVVRELPQWSAARPGAMLHAQ